MNIRIDNSGCNIILDLLTGNKRKIFRSYYIYNIDKETIMLELGIDEKEFKQILNIIKAKIRKHLIYKKCEQCQKHYYTPRENSTICDICKCQNSEYKKEKQSGEKANKKPKGSGIKCPHEILRRMEKYNKKHKTDLDYGYYVFISGE